VIRQSGTTFFEETDAKRDKINYGIHMHAVLSRMKYADDIEATLDQIIFEGLITDNDRLALRDELSELLAMNDVSTWFSKKWKVYTEVPILLPGGGESRLDRLIVSDKHAIVIDFKTGTKKKGDNTQVLAYMDSLRQMNFTEVEGFVLYLREKAVVEVKQEGKSRIVRKTKDKDQLSLGFG
jgi:hypothetical protein